MPRAWRVSTVLGLCALAAAGCTVQRSDRPALAGPSEAALSLNLSASPSFLTAGGTSQIVVEARDASRVPVSGVRLHFAVIVSDPNQTDVGTIVPADATTGTDGRTPPVTYTAPSVVGPAGLDVTVVVTPSAADAGNSEPRLLHLHVSPA